MPLNWPKLTPAEWAAFVGAAAWFPQIGQWIYGWIAKPSLRVTSAPTAEVGYGQYFGPILNMTLAMSTERKDAIIEKMTIEARHEQGDTHTFTWVYLNENFSEIRNPSGDTLEVSKNQPAIAVKVSTLSLTEKKVFFQDLEFQAKFKALTDKMGELFGHLASQKQEKIGAQVVQSREFASSRDYFRDNMYWREGTYRLTVNVTEVRSKNPHKEYFVMTFTKAHVALMRRNADLWGKETESLYLGVDKEKERIDREKSGAPQSLTEEPEKVGQWQWAYPEIQRSKK